jgi:putative heme iron utilization protein
MQSEDQLVLQKLLTEIRVLSLGVLVGGEPHVGLLPFVVTSDFRSVVVHASTLARHSRGLQTGSPYSALIHGPDGEGDPLQVPRATISGRVHQVAESESDYEKLRELYLGRFPSSLQTFSLGDFSLYRLDLERGRLVAGFARAVTLTRAAFAELADSGP